MAIEERFRHIEKCDVKKDIGDSLPLFVFRRIDSGLSKQLARDFALVFSIQCVTRPASPCKDRAIYIFSVFSIGYSRPIFPLLRTCICGGVDLLLQVVFFQIDFGPPNQLARDFRADSQNFVPVMTGSPCKNRAARLIRSLSISYKTESFLRCSPSLWQCPNGAVDVSGEDRVTLGTVLARKWPACIAATLFARSHRFWWIKGPIAETGEHQSRRRKDQILPLR